MTEREVFVASCGTDSEGESNSVITLETIIMHADASQDETVVGSLTFDGAPINIFRSLRSTIVDIKFESSADYDFVQAVELLNSFSVPENSMDPEADEIPSIQVTILPKELEGFYYITGVHGTWCIMPDEAGKMPNVIRFIFDNDLFATFSVPEDAIDEEAVEEGVIAEMTQ